MQVDFLLSRLKVLYERIDDTEDLINIELDHRYLPFFGVDLVVIGVLYVAYPNGCQMGHPCRG